MSQNLGNISYSCLDQSSTDVTYNEHIFSVNQAEITVVIYNNLPFPTNGWSIVINSDNSFTLSIPSNLSLGQYYISFKVRKTLSLEKDDYDTFTFVHTVYEQYISLNTPNTMYGYLDEGYIDFTPYIHGGCGSGQQICINQNYGLNFRSEGCSIRFGSNIDCGDYPISIYAKDDASYTQSRQITLKIRKIKFNVSDVVAMYDPNNDIVKPLSTFTTTEYGTPPYSYSLNHGTEYGIFGISSSENVYYLTIDERTEVGTYPNLSIICTDSQGYSTEEPFSITIEERILSLRVDSPLEVTFSNSTQNVPIQYTLEGANEPHTFSIAQNDTDFEIDGDSIVIPAGMAVGDYDITLGVSDSNGQTANADMEIIIRYADLHFFQYDVNSYFSIEDTDIPLNNANGGYPPYTYSISDLQQPDTGYITLYPTEGQLYLKVGAGTPVGNYEMTLTASDDAGQSISINPFVLSISEYNGDYPIDVTPINRTYNGNPQDIFTFEKVSSNFKEAWLSFGNEDGTEIEEWNLVNVRDTVFPRAAKTDVGTYYMWEKFDVFPPKRMATSTISVNFHFKEKTYRTTSTYNASECTYSTPIDVPQNGVGEILYSIEYIDGGNDFDSRWSIGIVDGNLKLTIPPNSGCRDYDVLIKAEDESSNTCETQIIHTVEQAEGYFSADIYDRAYTGEPQILSDFSGSSGVCYMGFGTQGQAPQDGDWVRVSEEGDDGTLSGTQSGTYYIWGKVDESTNYKAVDPTLYDTATISSKVKFKDKVEDTESEYSTSEAHSTEITQAVGADPASIEYGIIRVLNDNDTWDIGVFNGVLRLVVPAGKPVGEYVVIIGAKIIGATSYSTEKQINHTVNPGKLYFSASNTQSTYGDLHSSEITQATQSGYTGPFTYSVISVNGALEHSWGIGLDESNRLLFNIPSGEDVGVYSVVVSVSGYGNTSTSATITHTIFPKKLTIIPPSLHDGERILYDSEEHQLFDAGSCSDSGAVIYYTDSDIGFSESTWHNSLVDSINMKTDIGTYNLYYYVKVQNTANYGGYGIELNTKLGPLSCTIYDNTLAIWKYCETTSFYNASVFEYSIETLEPATGAEGITYAITKVDGNPNIYGWAIVEANGGLRVRVPAGTAPKENGSVYNLVVEASSPYASEPVSSIIYHTVIDVDFEDDEDYTSSVYNKTQNEYSTEIDQATGYQQMSYSIVSIDGASGSHVWSIGVGNDGVLRFTVPAGTIVGTYDIVVKASPILNNHENVLATTKTVHHTVNKKELSIILPKTYNLMGRTVENNGTVRYTGSPVDIFKEGYCNPDVIDFHYSTPSTSWDVTLVDNMKKGTEIGTYKLYYYITYKDPRDSGNYTHSVDFATDKNPNEIVCDIIDAADSGNAYEYERLDDDVSFQLLRTNPKLTTNTKVIYDGTDIFLESYSATPLLATKKYKGKKVKVNSLFNDDISDFMAGTSEAAYKVGYGMGDIIVGDSYDKQFETMYWSGLESIVSYTYPQTMGFVAPLYIRKKLPNYFVVFKIDGATDKDKSTFPRNPLENARIIKSFSLKEGTAIGDYIRKYVGQKGFEYDRSVHFNFTTKEAYFYGIDRSKGVLTEKVENFKSQLIDNDYTILHTDEWVTDGFERNNLIFPYIINLEFIFDDEDGEDYKFSRYFGMYCNDIDLGEYKIDGIETVDGTTKLSLEDSISIASNMKLNDAVYYVKDKYKEMYSINSSLEIMKSNVNEDYFRGYEPEIVVARGYRTEGYGRAATVLEISELADSLDFSIYMGDFERDAVGNSIDIQTEGSPSHMASVIAATLNDEFRGNHHTDSKGNVFTFDEGDYPSISYNYGWLNAYSADNYVFIESRFPSVVFNDMVCFEVDGDEGIWVRHNGFSGGTDFDGCVFIVLTSEEGKFDNDDGKERFARCRRLNRDARILSVKPYVDEDMHTDGINSVMATDLMGNNVTVSNDRYIEILTKYKPTIGVLSFFPIRDFDFDTIDSRYGNYSAMQAEMDSACGQLEIRVKRPNQSEYVEGQTQHDRGATNPTNNDAQAIYLRKMKKVNIRFGRFFDENGEHIDTEYDYFCENLLPELSTIGKTVPYINKWGYTDESKDSCENPYRFNTSKIFGTCNFSANTFVTNGDINEFTHSMPYYIIPKQQTEANAEDDGSEQDPSKGSSTPSSGDGFVAVTIPESDYTEYQYIEFDGDTDWESLKSMFEDTSHDYFLDVFGDTSESSYKNKRFSKKYSRFLNGNSCRNSSTLFRGVKFDIIDYKNGKELKSSKYNGYKFSFIYVPSSEFDRKVYVVKNDTFKFVVCIMFFYTVTNTIPFGKSNAYLGSMGYINVAKKDTSDEDTGGIQNPMGDEEMEQQLPDQKGNTSTQQLKTNVNVVMLDTAEKYNAMSAYAIKMDFILSEKDPSHESDYVVYSGTERNYRIRVIDPESLNTYDIFSARPIMNRIRQNILSSVVIGLKTDINRLMLKSINRHSGYYNPIFNDILFYKNFNSGNANEKYPYSNTSFDFQYEDEYGKFGQINNMWMHKVNEDVSGQILTYSEPYYPLIGEYAIDCKDYNVFDSTWKNGYFTKQIDINNSETCESVYNTKEEPCMFGSKYLKLPNRIEIDCFDNGDWDGMWDDDFIRNSESCPGEIMYSVGNNAVKYHMFLHKRIARFFFDKLLEEFEGYGGVFSTNKTFGIKDDLEKYIEKNIIRLYELKGVNVYVKKMQNSRLISLGDANAVPEDNYIGYIDMSKEQMIDDGFVRNINVEMSKKNTDAFDRQIKYYTDSTGIERIGFTFIIERI